MVKRKHKVLSLFSGIGGMDMGFGGQVVVHKKSIKDKKFIDSKHDTKNFVKLVPTNFKIVFQNDILEGAKTVCEINQTCHNYHTDSIYDLLNSKYKFPKVDVVVGGFPCQDFSHCGNRKGFKSDKAHDMKSDVSQEGDNSRGTLYKSFVKVVSQVKPKVFVAENVYGLLTLDGAIDQIVNDFSQIGYDVEYQLVDCSKYGIPQTRKRVIIMGISTTRKIQDMEEQWNVITDNKIKCNVGKYLEHLDEPEDTNDLSQKLYSKAKKLAKGQGQKEIDLDSFAPTIRAEHHGNIEFRRHENSTINPSECDLPERRLTLREAGLIQTFPPDYVFTERKSMVSYKYIGNAVPPLLGYLIARKVDRLILDYF